MFGQKISCRSTLLIEKKPNSCIKRPYIQKYDLLLKCEIQMQSVFDYKHSSYINSRFNEVPIQDYSLVMPLLFSFTKLCVNPRNLYITKIRPRSLYEENLYCRPVAKRCNARSQNTRSTFGEYSLPETALQTYV